MIAISLQMKIVISWTQEKHFLNVFNAWLTKIISMAVLYVMDFE